LRGRLNYEEFKMENGDSDTAKYPHRTGHNARSDFMHGVKRTTSPNPSPKGRGCPEW